MVQIDPIYSNHVVFTQARPDQLADVPKMDDIDPPGVVFCKVKLFGTNNVPINVGTLTVSSAPKSSFRVIDALPVQGTHVWIIRAFGGKKHHGYPIVLRVPGYAPVLATAVVLAPVTGPVTALFPLIGLAGGSLVAFDGLLNGATVGLRGGRMVV